MTSLSDLFHQNPEAQIINIKSLIMKLRITARSYGIAVENAYITVCNPNADIYARQKAYSDYLKAGYNFQDAMWVLRKEVTNFYGNHQSYHKQ